MAPSGTRRRRRPAPLVCDASSDLFSRPLVLANHALIYAGAQKNLGPSGISLVIADREFIETGNPDLSPLAQYRVYAKERSLHNTPNTFGIWMIGEVCRWILARGGLAAMAAANAAKAKPLYDFLDGSKQWRAHAKPGSRSNMNVTFRGASTAAEDAFLAARRGRRDVGPARSSLGRRAAREHLQRVPRRGRAPAGRALARARRVTTATRASTQTDTSRTAWGSVAGDKSIREAIAAIEDHSSVEVVVAVRAHARRWMAAHVVVGLVAAYAVLIYAVAFAWVAWAVLVIPVAAGLISMALVEYVPPLYRFLVPAPLRTEHVRTAARALFVARRIHATRDRTGLLVFIAVRGRAVELVGDIGVTDTLGETRLAHMAQALRAALPQGPAAVGRTLANFALELHDVFPRRADDINELDDAPVQVPAE